MEIVLFQRTTLDRREMDRAHCYMGLLPDEYNYGLRTRRECRERFPCQPRVSSPDMHHGTCVTHVPWCMPGSLTSGFLWSRWRGKRSDIPCTCAHRSFAYLARGPWNQTNNWCHQTRYYIFWKHTCLSFNTTRNEKLRMLFPQIACTASAIIMKKNDTACRSPMCILIIVIKLYSSTKNRINGLYKYVHGQSTPNCWWPNINIFICLLAEGAPALHLSPPGKYIMDATNIISIISLTYCSGTSLLPADIISIKARIRDCIYGFILVLSIHTIAITVSLSRRWS